MLDPPGRSNPTRRPSSRSPRSPRIGRRSARSRTCARTTRVCSGCSPSMRRSPGITCRASTTIAPAVDAADDLWQRRVLRGLGRVRDAGDDGRRVRRRGPVSCSIHWKFYLRSITNAIIDARIHVHGMAEEEAVSLMVEGGFQEEAEARNKYDRARLSSTQLSTYFTGSMEFWDIEREVRRRAAAASADPRGADAVPEPRVVGGYGETPGFTYRPPREPDRARGAADVTPPPAGPPMITAGESHLTQVDHKSADVMFGPGSRPGGGAAKHGCRRTASVGSQRGVQTSCRAASGSAFLAGPSWRPGSVPVTRGGGRPGSRRWPRHRSAADVRRPRRGARPYRVEALAQRSIAANRSRSSQSVPSHVFTPIAARRSSRAEPRLEQPCIEGLRGSPERAGPGRSSRTRTRSATDHASASSSSPRSQVGRDDRRDRSSSYQARLVAAGSARRRQRTERGQQRPQPVRPPPPGP